MKRFVLAAAIAAGLFWYAATASAQYRPRTTHNYGTMSGRAGTMSGHLQTNHNHLNPRPVTGYSPQYSGVVPGMASPYSSGRVILPNGGTPLGASLFPAPNNYNSSVFPSGGTTSLYGWNGWSYRR
jgi:hypothetical protein